MTGVDSTPQRTRRSLGRLLVTGALVVGAVLMRPGVLFGLAVVAAVFIPLERLFPLHRQRVRRTGWKTDLVHFAVNDILTTAGLVVLVVLVMAGLNLLVSTSLRDAVATQPGWLQFAEAFAIVELCGYAVHRANHRSAWLWRFHRVHHSTTEMDWLAAVRLHPVDQVITRSVMFVPLFVLGFSPATFGAFLVVLTVQALFVHSNVRFTFGPLRWIIATPEFHHWHHALDAEGRNANFAGEFPFIDLLFGTAHLPKGRWPQTYGIDESLPATYLAQLASPFRARPAPRAATPSRA